MAYVDPKLVKSPRNMWKLIEVLRNGERDGRGDGDASLAIGEWDEARVLAVRWNGSDDDDSGVGNPQSRGLPTWFVIPEWMNEAIVESDVIPTAKKALVKALLELD
jgi:hypothetical protein